MTQLAQAAPAETADCTSKIAALNDAARAGALPTSRIVLTRTLCDLIAGLSEDPAVRQTRLYEGKRALHRLINETPIDPGNDPYGEGDFGSIEVGGQTIFWKIDYYGKDLASGSPDPADQSVTTRILTVMLAEEY